MTIASPPRRAFLRQTAWLGVGVWAARLPAAPAGEAFDVCVYVGNASGVMARIRPATFSTALTRWS